MKMLEIRKEKAILKIKKEWIIKCKSNDLKKMYDRWLKGNNNAKDQTEEIKQLLNSKELYIEDRDKKKLLFQEKQNVKISKGLRKTINYILRQDKTFLEIDNDKALLSDSYIVIETDKNNLKAINNVRLNALLEKAIQNGWTLSNTKDYYLVVNECANRMLSKIMSETSCVSGYDTTDFNALKEIDAKGSYIINSDGIKARKKLIELSDNSIYHKIRNTMLYQINNDYRSIQVVLKN